MSDGVMSVFILATFQPYFIATAALVSAFMLSLVLAAAVNNIFSDR